MFKLFDLWCCRMAVDHVGDVFLWIWLNITLLIPFSPLIGSNVLSGRTICVDCSTLGMKFSRVRVTSAALPWYEVGESMCSWQSPTALRSLSLLKPTHFLSVPTSQIYSSAFPFWGVRFVQLMKNFFDFPNLPPFNGEINGI